MRKILKNIIVLFMTVNIVTNTCFVSEAHELDYANPIIVENSNVLELQDYEEPIIETNEELQEFKTNTEPCDIPFEIGAVIDNDIEQIDGIEAGSIANISELENMPQMLTDLEPNTDPNNAYGLTANTEYSGVIAKEGEVRWYAFDISTMTKVSMLIRTQSSMDPDIFLFKLNTNSMALESTNLSATNLGTEEYFTCVIGEGIYYFAVLGSSGSGAFILDFFENTNYVDREINDTVAAAQIIGSEAGLIEGSATGIIDTMRDVDYYKVVLNTPALVNIKFRSPQNHVLMWVNTDSSADRIVYDNGDNILGAGEHYLAVYNTKGEFFLGEGTYTISINVIVGGLTKDFNATGYKYYPEYQAILQFYPNRSRYFLNGIEIDMNCGFSEYHGSANGWSMNLYRCEGLIFNIKRYETFYTSITEKKEYTKVYIIEIGTEDGQTVFGRKVITKDNVKDIKDITHAVVAVDAITGDVVDIRDPLIQ